jgi:anti-sigma factor ChrR (cupin superfamily)
MIHTRLGFVRFDLDDDALDALVWKDFGNGTRMARLAREGEAGIVVYRLAKGCASGAFQAHVHPGGEAYLVLRGAVVDESGEYPAGSIVWMSPGSRHTPRGASDGETVIVVLWPDGVKGA